MPAAVLRNVPIDIVKIDGSFIADLGRVPEGLAVTAAITDLAHSLGLTVAAEAVETLAQSEAVAAIGCDVAQGFFYARPMTAAAISHELGHRAVGRVRRRRRGRPVALSVRRLTPVGSTAVWQMRSHPLRGRVRPQAG